MLTDLEIEGLKPRQKRYKAYDQNGLFLRIEPDGKRYWICRYRMNGKNGEWGLGSYPKIPLALARAMCTHMKIQRRQGIDLAPMPWFVNSLLEGVPHSEDNIAEAIRIAANKARTQPTIKERLSTVERQVERLTAALLTLGVKVDS